MKVMAVCSDAGYRVSMPIGDGHPYDLILDDGKILLRCQVKTARYRGGCLVFNLRSNNGMYQKKGSASRTYEGKIEVFGVYSPDFDSVFIVPIGNTGKGHKHLRIDPVARGEGNSDSAENYKVYGGVGRGV